MTSKNICKKCEKSFTLKGNLTKHLKKGCKGKKVIQTKFICNICDQVLTTKRNLSRHMKKTCKGKIIKKSTICLCEKCIQSEEEGIEWFTKSEFERHQASMLKKSQKKEISYICLCEKCIKTHGEEGKDFIFKSHFDIHQDIISKYQHLENITYCYCCNKDLKNKSNYNRHCKSAIHLGNKSYPNMYNRIENLMGADFSFIVDSYLEDNDTITIYKFLKHILKDREFLVTTVELRQRLITRKSDKINYKFKKINFYYNSNTVVSMSFKKFIMIILTKLSDYLSKNGCYKVILDQINDYTTTGLNNFNVSQTKKLRNYFTKTITKYFEECDDEDFGYEVEYAKWMENYERIKNQE